MLSLTLTQMDAMLAALIDTGGPFDPAAVFTGIATDINDQGVNTALSDLTTPDATDFPRKVITAWSAAYSLPDGRRAIDGPLHHFIGVGGDDQPVVSVYYLADALTAGNLLAWDRIIPSKTLASASDVLDMVVRLTIDPAGKWDATVIIPT